MTIQAIHQFPRGFLWGCATAAHQVEGGNVNDWWRWEMTPGHVWHDIPSGQACEWWKGRYIEDFDRAASMHNNAQRISVEWSRIEPEPGKWDNYALEKYRDMLKAMRDRRMEPMVTLHHFTNPLWFADKGGWLWSEAPARFAAFVKQVVTALGDLCTLWCTINEPMVYATKSFLFGEWTPGKASRRHTYTVVLNLLQGHSMAYHAIKEVQPQAQVGFANHQVALKPGQPAAINAAAANTVHSFFNGTFVNALTTGVVRLPSQRPVTLPHIKGTLDWVGLQYYQVFEVVFNPTKPTSLFIWQRKPKDMPVGPAGWGGLQPSELFQQIGWLYRQTNLPIYITEVGLPDPEDSLRPAYLAESVRAAWSACNFNFPVRGFFWWSLVDNYEWAEGFDPRFSFGLYQVDFATQQRTERPSAALYRDICGANGLSSTMIEEHVPTLLPKLFPGGEGGQMEVKLKSGGNRPLA